MEILGLLDTLESMILDSPKIPLTRRVMVDEGKVLAVIDKIRLVVESGEDFVKKAIDSERRAEVKKAVVQVVEIKGPGGTSEETEGKAIEIIQQAYQIAKEVRLGADKYADEVLAQLEVTSSRVLRAIRNGRLKLSKVMGQEVPKEPAPEEKTESSS